LYLYILFIVSNYIYLYQKYIVLFISIINKNLGTFFFFILFFLLYGTLNKNCVVEKDGTFINNININNNNLII